MYIRFQVDLRLKYNYQNIHLNIDISRMEIIPTFISLSSYKHALDGLYRVYRDEGTPRMFSGVTMASSRAVFVTIGQVSILFSIVHLSLSAIFFSS